MPKFYALCIILHNYGEFELEAKPEWMNFNGSKLYLMVSKILRTTLLSFHSRILLFSLNGLNTKLGLINEKAESLLTLPFRFLDLHCIKDL